MKISGNRRKDSTESRRWSATFKNHALKEFDRKIVDLLSEIVNRILSLIDGWDSKRPAKASTASRALGRHFVIQPPIASLFKGLSAVST